MKEMSLILIAIALMFSCNKTGTIEPGNDPNFTIVSNEDAGFSSFNRKVEVFGIPIYAKKRVDDLKLLHAANILAQYLDNDEDGAVDNELVHASLLDQTAFMFMWNSKSDMVFASLPDNAQGQDLGSDETSIDWHSNGHTGQFDAALEEVLHLITHVGYSSVYPGIFGEYHGTSLCNAMDVARGGYFEVIPDEYPDAAWYHYDDFTCDYSCMATEYLYWALTSHLGAQSNRQDEIAHEWELISPELLQVQDSLIFALLTNEEYKLPSILPDGTYMR